MSKDDLTDIVVNGVSLSYNRSKGEWVRADTGIKAKAHSSYITSHLAQLVKDDKKNQLNNQNNQNNQNKLEKEDKTDKTVKMVETKVINTTNQHGSIIAENYQGRE